MLFFLNLELAARRHTARHQWYFLSSLKRGRGAALLYSTMMRTQQRWIDDGTLSCGERINWHCNRFRPWKHAPRSSVHALICRIWSLRQTVWAFVENSQKNSERWATAPSQGGFPSQGGGGLAAWLAPMNTSSRRGLLCRIWLLLVKRHERTLKKIAPRLQGIPIPPSDALPTLQNYIRTK